MRGDLGPDGVKEETGCGFGGGQHAGPPGRGRGGGRTCWDWVPVSDCPRLGAGFLFTRGDGHSPSHRPCLCTFSR